MCGFIGIIGSDHTVHEIYDGLHGGAAPRARRCRDHHVRRPVPHQEGRGTRPGHLLRGEHGASAGEPRRGTRALPDGRVPAAARTRNPSRSTSRSASSWRTTGTCRTTRTCGVSSRRESSAAPLLRLRRRDRPERIRECAQPGHRTARSVSRPTTRPSPRSSAACVAPTASSVTSSDTVIFAFRDPVRHQAHRRGSARARGQPDGTTRRGPSPPKASC